MTAAELVVAAVLLLGVALNVLAGIGLHQFPDVFARMHASTKPATLGLLCILVAAAVSLQNAAAVAKLLLVVVLQFVTAPVAAHMIGRAAYQAGTELNPNTLIDELAQQAALDLPVPDRAPGDARDYE